MANLTKGNKKGFFARLADLFSKTTHEAGEAIHHVAEKAHIVKSHTDAVPGAGSHDDPAKTTGLDHASQQANEQAFDAGVFKGTQHGKSYDQLNFKGGKKGKHVDNPTPYGGDGIEYGSRGKAGTKHKKSVGSFNFVPGDIDFDTDWK